MLPATIALLVLGITVEQATDLITYALIGAAGAAGAIGASHNSADP